jgi:hypothetical protein
MWLNDDIVQHVSDASGNIIIGEELCCAKLLYDFFKLEQLHNKYLDDILTMSLISDDINSRKGLEGTPVYDAFIRLKNKTIENCLLQLEHCTDISQIKDEEYDWFAHNVERASTLLESAEEIYPGVGYIKAFSGNNVNYTLLCEQAYKKYKILIIKELDAHNMRMSFTIASSLDHLDLTKVFSLRAGSPRRITITKRDTTIDDILNIIKPHLSTA